MAFINKYDYINLPFDNKNKQKVFTAAVQNLISTLESSFNSDETFSFSILDSLVQGVALKSFPEVMAESDVVSFCESGNADLLLVLEFFDAYFLTETEVEEDEDGAKSRTNYVDLIVEAGFTLYSKTGEFLDRVKVTESNFYQARPSLSSLIVIGPSMGKAEEEVNDLVKRIGENYINNFYPGSEMIRTKIYTGKAFKEVTPLIDRRDWLAAIDLLLPLTKSSNSKTAKKAMHNLAGVYEVKGNYEASEYWKRKSKE
ncbi:MAG: DUF6340 family protein [Bacteroidota bacterium]|nr:DUF6340 family protein [Bacteroidota bacterium]